MNRISHAYISKITAAEDAYQDAAREALLRYRDTKGRITEEARKYKDERGFIDAHLTDAKAVARDELARAESAYRASIRSAAAGLKAELLTAINAPIPEGFTERLNFYRQAALTPTKTDAESLLALAGKSPLAVRATAKLLDDLHSPVRITSRSIDEFESDIAALDELAEMPLTHAPHSCFTELCDVMAGQPVATRTKNGFQNIGNTWRSDALLTNGAFIREHISRIEAATDAWSADISYEIAERQSAEEEARAREEAEAAGEQYTPDREPVSTTGIADRGTDGIELAAAMGRRIAENTATAARTIENYSR